MSAPLSVVIPTLQAAARIGPTLAALVPGAADGLIREVILADGGSEDAIAEVAEDAGATLIRSEPGRGAQLRGGAAATRGDWLLFVHADTVLTGEWIGAIRHHIQRHPGRVGYFRLRFDAEGFAPAFVAGWANLRSRLFGLPYGDQGLLIARRDYEALGGFRPLSLMEDVEIVRRIGRKRLRMLPAEALTCAERYERAGWFRRGARNWRCLAMYLIGVAPTRIAELYRR